MSWPGEHYVPSVQKKSEIIKGSNISEILNSVCYKTKKAMKKQSKIICAFVVADLCLRTDKQ